MRPSVVVLGFVLGSVASISFGLLGVSVVFAVLSAEHPRLQGEFPFLLGSLAAFSALTVIAAASFYGQLRGAGWRRAAIGALVASLLAVGWFYWPK